MKTIKKPITLRFKRLDGSIFRCEAMKIIKEPIKVNFCTKKKRYRQ